ncbi:MAG: hypothetical protein FRX49_10315 [Trebouxia sp. A1-2]|nr:MAG: hypothetical protein FRX49_10315 [Trebouxia sp. A1-2]
MEPSLICVASTLPDDSLLATQAGSQPLVEQEYKPGSITLAAVDSLLPVKIIIQMAVCDITETDIYLTSQISRDVLSWPRKQGLVDENVDVYILPTVESVGI